MADKCFEKFTRCAKVCGLYFLDCAFWALIGWAGKLWSHGWCTVNLWCSDMLTSWHFYVGYLKLYQLRKPTIPGFDCLLIDEAQDCTPGKFSWPPTYGYSRGSYTWSVGEGTMPRGREGLSTGWHYPWGPTVISGTELATAKKYLNTPNNPNKLDSVLVVSWCLH